MMAPSVECRRVVLINGWLRRVDYPHLWMKPLKELLESTHDLQVVGNTEPINTGDIGHFIRYMKELVGPDVDSRTFFIGQSVGCQLILRYLAQLPPDTRVGGFLAVGCWLSLDFVTDQKRSPAIDRLIQGTWEVFQEWMDPSTIDFENVRRVCPNLMALCSNNDPLVGLDDGGEQNQRDWAKVVGARVVVRPGKGHYNGKELDKNDLRLVIEDFLGLSWQGEECNGHDGCGCGGKDNSPSDGPSYGRSCQCGSRQHDVAWSRL